MQFPTASIARALTALPVLAAAVALNVLPAAPAAAAPLTDPTGGTSTQITFSSGGTSAFTHPSGIRANLSRLVALPTFDQPDLQVASRFSIPIAGDSSGTFYTVYVTVKNAGTAQSGATQLAFTYQGSTTRLSVPAIAAGSTAQVSNTVFHENYTNCVLDLRVDPDNVVSESNESNNHTFTDACTTY